MSILSENPIVLPSSLPLPATPQLTHARLSTAGLALALVVPPAGLVISIIVAALAAKEGSNSRKATAGIIVGVILMAIELSCIAIFFIGAFLKLSR
jgi:hypothetical protein